MKSLSQKIACAALALGLSFGASAAPSLPVALAPASAPTSSLMATSGRVIIVVVIVTRAQQAHTLENTDQSQFDRTN